MRDSLAASRRPEGRAPARCWVPRSAPRRRGLPEDDEREGRPRATSSGLTNWKALARSCRKPLIKVVFPAPCGSRGGRWWAWGPALGSPSSFLDEADVNSELNFVLRFVKTQRAVWVVDIDKEASITVVEI